jgi:hypothetical protein
MKVLKELASKINKSFFHNLRYLFLQLSNDPTLSSLPLLSTFLKAYSRPYLGIVPPTAAKQISALAEPGKLSSTQSTESGAFPSLAKEDDELVEQEIRDRFKRMCEGYFENVCKKLIIEHTVNLFFTAPHIDCLKDISDFKNRIDATTKRTFDQERSLKIVNRHTKR